MATVNGDDNGVIETCDDVDATCDECQWTVDGDGRTVLEEAEAHVDKTGHGVSVSGTYSASVTP